MGKVWKTACPLNCWDVCGLVVTTDNNRITNITGDNDHPITKGSICSKGKMLADRIYDNKRLLYPLKKEDGKYVRISWEQALTEISAKMMEAKEAYGPKSVLHSYDYSSGGLLKGLDQRFFNFFGGCTEVTGSLCWGAGIQAQRYDFGDSLSHDVNDIKNAKTIVIWGRNITNTNMHLYPFILEAKELGARIIVINPKRNGSSKIADENIIIKPGMDGILALAVSKVIIENNWYDNDFIDSYTIGFEQFRVEALKIDLDKAAKEMSIDKQIIYQLAESLALHKPATVFLGLGMQRYKNGGNTIRAIDALMALTGNIGIKGGGINYANLAVGRSFNWQKLLREDLRTEYRTFARPSQADEIINANEPPIKLMFITRSNAVVQLPDVEKTVEAFSKVETIVVMDMFMTDTARIADYILPITSVFEEEDIYYGSMFHGIIRYGPKIIDPPGEAWSDLQIWTALAKKLGLKGFEISVKEYLELALEPLNKHGINLEQLKRDGQVNLPLYEVPWEEKGFNTPSGKFEFYSEQAKLDGLSPVALAIYPKGYFSDAEMANRYHFLSIHPNRSLHSQHFINTLNDKPQLILSPKIAAENRLEDGEIIKLYNDRGSILGKVKILTGNHENTIIIEEGYWLDSDGTANKLTSNENSDMGSGSILYDCTVSIEKL